MSLNTEFLFNAMVRQFGSYITSERFQKDFVDACNAALDEMSFQAQLETPITHIKKQNDDISVLGPEHSSIMLVGIAVWLILSGYEHVEGPNAYRPLDAKWEDLKGNFQVMTSWDEQSVRDDNGVPTADIVGNGNCGDEVTEES